MQLKQAKEYLIKIMKLLIKKYKFLFLGLILGHIFLLVRLKFTAWPEMTLWPYLMLKGWLPYRDIAIAHTPLMFFDLILVYKLFGVGIWQLKIYTWMLIVLTDIVLVWVASKLWNKKVAIFALLFYIPLQLYYEGNGLWFDLSLAPVALLIYYFLRKKDYLVSGVLWGIAFFLKQSAFWFLIPILIVMIDGKWLMAKKKIVNFSLGAVLVSAAVLLILWGLGIIAEFWFWAVKFGIGILPKSQGQVSFPTIAALIKTMLPFSALALPFLKKDKKYLHIGAWSVFGILGAFPRFELFHFQPGLPFLSIVYGLLIVNYKKLKKTYKYLTILVIVLSFIMMGRGFLRDWGKGMRFFEQDFIKLVNYIDEKTSTDDKIYVLNAWDSAYAFSNTLPAVRPWVPHLSWYMGLPGVQEKIVIDLERGKPEMIVMREYADFGLSSYKPELIDKFITENYEISDKIDGHLILLLKE